MFKEKNRQSILKSFTERERGEIAGERDFLIHWTAREAFVKLYGLSVFAALKKLEFYGGKLYLEGKVQPVKIKTYAFPFGVASVCTEE